MSPSSDEVDELDQSQDDGQLTIRIPNPSVYLARNSQWTGRRGKPRCDYCRLSNLKCDRVLPVCNHCSWTPGRECKYTPLPTPAHRGIPRCDRCRIKNIKQCDRNLPICNHCASDNQGPCNYTPKRRHKVPTDPNANPEPYSSQSLSFVPVEPVDGGRTADFNEFYGHNIASSSANIPPIACSSTDPSIDLQSSGHISAQNGASTSAFKPRRSRSNFVPHPLSAQQISYIVPFETWTHPSFAPLPSIVRTRLLGVNAAEMPTRENFDEALVSFLSDLIPQLRETAAFPPDTYKAIAYSLTGNKVSSMSESVRTWTACHRARSGSSKYSLIVLPVDEMFRISVEQANRLGDDYVARIDGGNLNESEVRDELDSFDRIPVQNQIYDILAFTHASHGDAFSMLAEVRKLCIAGITLPMAEIFVNLCPLCDNAT